MNSCKAKVFYHVDEKRKQEIIVDAQNIEGNILFPELTSAYVAVSDIRLTPIKPTFEKDSLEFFDFSSEVDSFEGKDFEEQYNREIESLLKEKVNAQEVIIFDHTVREDRPSSRPPARHAHIDYSEKSAHDQVQKHIPKQEQGKWLNGHYAIVNTWKPIQNKVLNAPLGFVLPRSYTKEELIEIDLVYPNRRGEVLGALYNKEHEWVFLNEMAPNEIVLFNMYDSRGRKPIIHSALDFESKETEFVRKSIESRILIRFS